MDFEGPLVEQQTHHGTGEESIKRRQCMYWTVHLYTIALADC